MAPPSRRADDPDAFDGRPFRSEQDEIALRYRSTTFSARGLGVYFALAIAGIIVSQVYTGWRIEQAIWMARRASATEHASIARAEDRTSCMLTLTLEDRTKFRSEYAPGAFRKWCPWVEAD